MRYWAFLIAKLIAAFGIAYGLDVLINRLLPPPKAYIDGGPFPANHVMVYSIAMFGLALFTAGLTWLVIWDQRYRCRTCLRRLRMPIQTGSWTTFCSAPRTPSTFASTDTVL